MQDLPKPGSELPEESGATIDLSDEILPWWRRSPPLDSHATFGYLLMLPLLLIVPAFSAAGLRLAWLAYAGRESSSKYVIVALAVSAAIANWLAIAGFGIALLRIFGH